MLKGTFKRVITAAAKSAAAPVSKLVTEAKTAVGKFIAVFVNAAGQAMALFDRTKRDITVVLPWAFRTTVKASKIMQDGLSIMFNAPQQAMVKLAAAVEALMAVKDKVQAVITNTKEIIMPQVVPAWMQSSTYVRAVADLKTEFSRIYTKAERLAGGVGSASWKKEKAFFIKYRDMMLAELTGDLFDTFNTVKSAIVDPVQKVFSDWENVVATFRLAKASFETTTNQISRAFAPKFDHKFTRGLRDCNEKCQCSLSTLTCFVRPVFCMVLNILT